MCVTDVRTGPDDLDDTQGLARHLLNLLELLPWREIDDGDLWLLDNNAELNAALETRRWSQLAAASRDYRRLREHCGDRTALRRVCACMLDVFDGDDPHLFEVIGAMLRTTLSLQLPGETLGRRWCSDLAATAWSITVTLVADDRRQRRS